MGCIVLGLLLIVVVYSYIKKQQKSPSSGWHIRWSPGMDRKLPGNNWTIDFPTNPEHHVHYVQWFNPPKLGKYISVKFRIKGNDFVPQEFPDRTATVSVLLQRKGDNWTAQGKFASYRWYSNNTISMFEGEHSIFIPLTVSNWIDVYGGKDSKLFQEAIDNIENVGLVFGSAGGRGHGVYSVTPGSFELISFEVV